MSFILKGLEKKARTLESTLECILGLDKTRSLSFIVLNKVDYGALRYFHYLGGVGGCCEGRKIIFNSRCFQFLEL